MTEQPSKHDGNVYETFLLLVEANNLRPVDVAKALNVQLGSLKRSMEGNPTVSKLRGVAWAIGCETWHLLMKPETVKLWLDAATIRFEAFTLAHKAKAHSIEYTQAKQARKSRAVASGASGRVPTREELAGVYPPKAMASEVMDTNYIDYSKQPAGAAGATSSVDWDQRREELSAGLPDHLVMSEGAVERGYSYAQYKEATWTLEALQRQGVVVQREGAE